MYDFLVVGAGLFGSSFARQMTDMGFSILVIDQRVHVGGNIADTEIHGIRVHQYGPHIFHTNDEGVWRFLNRFTEFHPYRHRVLAFHEDRHYPLPVNLETLSLLFGITTPDKAETYFKDHCFPCETLTSFEDVLKNKVGNELYRRFFEHYTFKQWKRSARQLPPEMGKRVPVRLDSNCEYFTDHYQGIPISYSRMIHHMLKGIDVQLETDFFTLGDWRKIARNLLFTGEIDRFFDYRFGPLEYIRLAFEETYIRDQAWYQSVAVVNYPDPQYPFTRITEHKYFLPSQTQGTIITREYSSLTHGIPCYPVPTTDNRMIYEKYRSLLPKNVYISGRLGGYQYIDMDITVRKALDFTQIFKSCAKSLVYRSSLPYNNL
jgi:UDP-galactopyranose mutase